MRAARGLTVLAQISMRAMFSRSREVRMVSVPTVSRIAAIALSMMLVHT